MAAAGAAVASRARLHPPDLRAVPPAGARRGTRWRAKVDPAASSERGVQEGMIAARIRLYARATGAYRGRGRAPRGAESIRCARMRCVVEASAGASAIQS